MYAQNIIQEKIIAPAMKDEMFRQRLLSSPKMVLEGELGITLPQKVNVQVHEDTTTTVHLVLPQQLRAQEVSDADLEHDPSILTYSYDCGPTLGCC